MEKIVFNNNMHEYALKSPFSQSLQYPHLEILKPDDIFTRAYQLDISGIKQSQHACQCIYHMHALHHMNTMTDNMCRNATSVYNMIMLRNHNVCVYTHGLHGAMHS